MGLTNNCERQYEGFPIVWLKGLVTQTGHPPRWPFNVCYPLLVICVRARTMTPSTEPVNGYKPTCGDRGQPAETTQGVRQLAIYLKNSSVIVMIS